MICLRYLGHNPGSMGRVQARVTSKVSSEIHSHIYKQKTVTLPVFCTSSHQSINIQLLHFHHTIKTQCLMLLGRNIAQLKISHIAWMNLE